MNALRHGVFSKRNQIPGESVEESAALAEEYVEHHRPKGPAETLKIRQMISYDIALQRSGRAGSSLLCRAYRRAEEEAAQAEAAATVENAIGEGKIPAAPGASSEQVWTSVVHSALRRIKTAGEDEDLSGPAHASSSESLWLLRRYEVSIERSYERALKSLESLQANRRKAEAAAAKRASAGGVAPESPGEQAKAPSVSEQDEDGSVRDEVTDEGSR